MRAFNKNHRLGSRKYGHNYMYGYGYVYDMTSFENLGHRCDEDTYINYGVITINLL